MCNTGIYFMELGAARQLSQVANEYLERAATLSPQQTGNFLIDSFILWSAQQMLRFNVDIFSLRLNYIVPAEDFYEEYLLDEMAAAGFMPSLDVTDSDQILQHLPISLFHFSRGSDIHFVMKADATGDNHDSCSVVLRRNSRKITLMSSFFHSVMKAESGELVCSVFFEMLEPFTEFVTLRDDAATSYFRS
jgi:hypothetical protein